MNERMTNEDFMKQAIALAVDSVRQGGGPFGALIVRNGEVVASGVNRVTLTNDPTSHAEVNAIRAACLKLGTFNLAGCVIYTSCEPCPMCLGAIYWAHIDRVYYGANKNDAAAANFDDSFIYSELSLDYSKRATPFENILPDEARRPFDEWSAKSDKTIY